MPVLLGRATGVLLSDFARKSAMAPLPAVLPVEVAARGAVARKILPVVSKEVALAPCPEISIGWRFRARVSARLTSVQSQQSSTRLAMLAALASSPPPTNAQPRHDRLARYRFACGARSGTGQRRRRARAQLRRRPSRACRNRPIPA